MRSTAGTGLVGLCAGLVAAMSAAGCCTEPEPKTVLSRGELVARYNDNAARIPRLWARAQMDIRFPYEQRTIWLTPSGTLHLAKGADRLAAQDFVLIGRESGQSVFRVGSSIADSVYYFWTHFGDNSSGMYGLNQFAGAPGRGMLPIDPHQLLSVLCVTELPVDFTQAPTVLLTMDTTPCNYAYVLTYIDHQPVTNRLFARREIYLRWSDKEEPRPFMIKYFDGQGRRIMIAKLGSYRPIKMLDAGDEQSAAPEMPSEIDIVWPQTNSRIHLSLSEMSTKDVDPELFLFWDRLPDGMRGVIRSVDDVDGPAPTDATTVPASAPAAANGRDAKEAM